MATTLKDKILKTLIDAKKLTKEDVDEAISLQKKKGIGLDKALVEKGHINEKDLMALLVKELNIPFINLKKYKIDPELQEIVSEKIARQYHIVPLSILDYTLTIALSDPFNIFVVDDLKNITGKEIDIVMSTNAEILKAIDAYYGVEDEATVTELSKDIQVEDFEIVSEMEDTEDVGGVVDESEKAPIIRMVNLIIKEAIRRRASDIHIEPEVDGMRVRYRIDGVLLDILNIPKENQNAVIVRIKIMGRLDITTIHTPQDTVENARSRLSSGEASNNKSHALAPDQNSIANRIPRKTVALPRSGWSPTSMNGTPTITNDGMKSTIVKAGRRRPATCRANMRITPSLANSAGWPMRRPAIDSQDRVPLAVPAPVPISNVRARRTNATT